MRYNYYIGISLLVISLNFIFIQSVFSQDKIDSAKFRASYLFSYKTNTEQSDFAQTDLMFLDIGKNASKYYSHAHQVRDSVTIAGINQGLHAHEVVANMRGFARGTSNIVYIFSSDNSFHVAERFAIDVLYIEPRTRPDWQIQNETKEIEGYTAQRATVHYLGRNWIVYFTTEIPINQGPWKLWGLPGLILEAADEEKLFNFEFNGFESVHTEIPIIYTITTPTGREYRQVGKSEFMTMKRMRYADPMEFMRLFVRSPEGTVTMTPEQQENNRRLVASGGIPYIPLEPWQ